MSNWKTKRKEILAALDENMGKRVETAQRKYGDIGGKLASGVAAAGSAAADFFTPEDETEVVMMAGGGVLGKALGKLKKLKKAEKLAGMADAAADATRKAEISKLLELGKKNPTGLEMMEDSIIRQFKKGDIDATKYATKRLKIKEAKDLLKKEGK
jgi:regulator of protease activity HflC (stomatin/prohibitin superfamily)